MKSILRLTSNLTILFLFWFKANVFSQVGQIGQVEIISEPLFIHLKHKIIVKVDTSCCSPFNPKDFNIYVYTSSMSDLVHEGFEAGKAVYSLIFTSYGRPVCDITYGKYPNTKKRLAFVLLPQNKFYVLVQAFYSFKLGEWVLYPQSVSILENSLNKWHNFEPEQNANPESKTEIFYPDKITLIIFKHDKRDILNDKDYTRQAFKYKKKDNLEWAFEKSLKRKF